MSSIITAQHFNYHVPIMMFHDSICPDALPVATMTHVRVEPKLTGCKSVTLTLITALHSF